MRMIKRIIPHLAISFSLATLVVTIVNMFNPRMGFLNSSQALVLIIITVFLSVISAVIAISGGSGAESTATASRPASRVGKHVK